MTPRKPRRPQVPSLLPDVLNPVHQLRLMGRLVRRYSAKPGGSPGTLVASGTPKVERVRIDTMAYDPGAYREWELARVSEALPLPPAPSVSWINVEGLHDVEVIRELGQALDIHPLVLEDIVNTGQRPKFEEYDRYLYVILSMLSLDRSTGTVQEEQISLVLGSGWVLTFQERAGDVFDPVRERIRKAGSRIRDMGADYLAYALIDSIVDHYFVVLETIGDVVEEVEIEVMEDPSQETMHRLHGLKREMLMVRRAVWPVRDVTNGMVRTENALVTAGTKVFLRDVYDHAVRIIDTVEVLRDLVGSTIDLYLSSVSHRTNEVMKTLTVMASIFIPLTFLAGLYGMNFEFMPELDLPWAYPALLGVMVVVGGAMVWHFWRKGWL